MVLGPNNVVKGRFQTQFLGTMLPQPEQSKVRRCSPVNGEYTPRLQLYTQYVDLNVGFARQQKFAGHPFWHLNDQSCLPQGL